MHSTDQHLQSKVLCSYKSPIQRQNAKFSSRLRHLKLHITILDQLRWNSSKFMQINTTS